MPGFPFNLAIPEPLYECHNTSFCPEAEFRTADHFHWWNPSSVQYRHPPRPNTPDPKCRPWQHRILYPTDVNRPTSGWWCQSCITALQEYSSPSPSQSSTVPMTEWLARNQESNKQGKYDMVLTDIKGPEPFYQCGHPECKYAIPAEELTHCAFVYSNSKTKTNIPKLNHNWLCTEHTDDFYSNIIYHQPMAAQIGPTLQALTDIKARRPKSHRSRRRRRRTPKN